MISASRGATAESLDAGRRIFTTQCTACHSAVAVGKYPAARWTEIVAIMSPRARLNPGQEQTLLAYVIAARDTPASATR